MLSPDQIAELLALEFCAVETLHYWRHGLTEAARRDWENQARAAMENVKKAGRLIAGDVIDMTILRRLMRERLDDLAQEMAGLSIGARPAQWPAHLAKCSKVYDGFGMTQYQRVEKMLQDRTNDNRRWIEKLDRILALHDQHPVLIADAQKGEKR